MIATGRSWPSRDQLFIWISLTDTGQALDWWARIEGCAPNQAMSPATP